jgi:hypothetical protein
VPQTERAQKFFVVAAGSSSAKCKGETCGATIYFVRNPVTGRPVPVSCDVEGGRRPSESKDVGQLDAFGGEADVHDGRGLSHFLDCPDADDFSRSPR